MKTAEDKAFDYANDIFVTLRDNGSTIFNLDEIFEFAKQDYIAGYNEAQRWIRVEEELPSRENYQHEKCLWKNEKNIWYGSAYESQKPTHWRPIND